ncbi:FAD-binding oxidoreductase [Aquibacillus koreensis]|uniref:FAD-binding oxidoreductase n=1 Tax=Aquibacillus koreensis TaxID=279446 RepID=A0A9X4AK77_9BACI|nr:FAD-binding oxidoreductase [Aquibacillus koreensis]MCT2537787.1 FAD-binding oxidoreductase [Aquibacillus koreensis]MDC3421180.1 FAD-binding oxidoreductase [Aquibacillus koreensis]
MKVWIDQLKQVIGEEQIIVKEAAVERLSKDFYWYSPVLYEELKDKVADCAVQPTTVDALKAVVTFAVEHRIPLTPRGAGTGNYGQAIPLDGGIVLDLTKLDQILQIRDGEVHVQSGLRLGMLEKTLRKEGKELHIYPSTFMKSTVGGFLCGGSGGIGSIRWGNLWDGNVLEVTVMTVEKQPRIFTLKGDAVRDYIHNYGTTGIVIEAVLPIEPKTEWSQHIVSFDTFEQAVTFSDELAHEEAVLKRLVSVCEWPIPSHFQQLKKFLPENKSIVMLETNEQNGDELSHFIQKHKGEVSFSIPASKYHKGLKVSDFTWNHATLWAHKHGENMTYLQARFDTSKVFDQMKAIRDRFGYEVQFHFEYIKINGKVTPASLPVIIYQSKERLYEIIAFFEANGVMINNPHTYYLGFGGYNLRMEEITKLKQENDPYDLLNRGKIPKPEHEELVN